MRLLKQLIRLIFNLSLCAVVSEAKLRRNTQGETRRLQTSVSVRGDNGSPTSEYPLGLCEGDCDSGAECGPNLICFQRDPGQAVPGCSGGENDHSRADYCIAADSDVQSSSSPPSPPAPAPAPGPAPSNNPFLLKLYWQQGYDWQGETFERKWCLRCHDGQNSCNAGDTTLIVDCDVDPTNWVFITHSNGEIQIKVRGEDLCLERSGTNIYQQGCDAGHIMQRWVSTRGSYDSYRFEFSPASDTSLCATQDHHPKNRETIFLESCEIARRDITSYWNKY